MPTNLIGLSKSELTAQTSMIGVENFRNKQLWQWIYHRGVQDFNDISNFSKDLQKRFSEHFSIKRPEVVKDYISFDRTRKWLLKFSDGEEAETVYIPDETRGTLCISSQVGCTLTCKFCHTGTQRLVRNLTAGEIVSQLLVALDLMNEWPAGRKGRMISNIVMMGMGEPLFNYDNVSEALKIMMDHEGLSISKRKITLSTSGIVPLIERCGKELGVNLAISLHAVTDELRDEIMPINKKYPIKTLLDACRNYPASSNARRITFEYVMLKNVNDSINDAKALVKLIKGIPAKINLIPFNPWPESNYECSAWQQIEEFASVVQSAGYASPIRTPRGRDILAACGQLRSEGVRKSKSILVKIM
ncbi:MAG: 23S rRNA (adenine(2503)-C(2))-methyltransferase RlmN [Rickettsiales endosymbiont of Dermacentor nuttalli]